MTRQLALVACMSMALALSGVTVATAEDYPTKPVEMTITFGAGGTGDISGRLAAQAASAALGQPIAIVNRVGGGGGIGFDHVRNVAPDGYGIGWLSASILTTTLLGTLPQKWDDWEYVANVTVDPVGIVVSKDAPWQTMEEFLAHARENPMRVRVGHAGVGSFTYMVAAALANVADIETTFVPVGDRRVPALLSGEVEAISVGVPEVISTIRGGEMRLLGVLSPERLSVFGDVPTFAELGYDLGFYQFRGVFVPKGTPLAIKEKLDEAFRLAAEDEALLRTAEEQGFSAFYVGLDDYPAYIEDQNRILSGIINDLGLAGQ